MSSTALPVGGSYLTPVRTLNARHHRTALNIFMFVVLAHWAEHIIQAIQVWALGWPRPAARGILGYYVPWLISTEWLHYGYAVVMLAGLFLLRSGFSAQARPWWDLALIIQFWHHIEHLLLLIQAWSGVCFFGGTVPTSVLQVFFPRVELHLFYNTVVTVPMVIAVVIQMRGQRRPSRAASTAPSTAA